MCGEKGRKAGVFKLAVGSPPHVRGKVPHVPVAALPQGITPACAGKSFKQLVQAYDEGDHPRMCGEKIRLSVKLVQCLGSPPHVRGKVSSL